jgi:hypothetical protein
MFTFAHYCKKKTLACLSRLSWKWRKRSPVKFDRPRGIVILSEAKDLLLPAAFPLLGRLLFKLRHYPVKFSVEKSIKNMQ